MRKFLMATAVLALVAANGLALNEQNTAWGKGPAQYLMTKEEVAQWKNIRTDADAQAFIDLFWARRDPTPDTAQNEFRAEFDARVQYADEKFGAKKKKGSMTDRGRVFVLFGPPTRMARKNVTEGPPMNTGDFNNSATNTQAAGQAWIYEGDKATQMFGPGRVEISFSDQFGSGEYTLDALNYNVNAAATRWNQKSITQPNLTVAPKFETAVAAPRPAAPAVAAPAPAPVATAPATLTEFRTPAFRSAVDQFRTAKKSPYEKQIFATWGEFVTAKGEYYVPVSLYVPKATGLTAAQNLTFFGVVEDATGKPVAVFEEPATLTATRDDLYFDKSLTLPAGKHRGVFGLAENGTPISMVSTEMELAGTLDHTAAGVSRLILSNNVFPLSAAQAATDPFAFGGIKVVPKADRAFRSSDELWYFIEMRNPGLDEAKQPKIQAKIDLEGTDETGRKVKMSAPPSEVPATEFKGSPGHYGVGSAIPLETFKPGEYTLTIKLMDTVAKTSHTLKETFRVVQ